MIITHARRWNKKKLLSGESTSARLAGLMLVRNGAYLRSLIASPY